jgi:hypothetical protein
MALCHKWDVKNDFAYVLQFFSLISDVLGSVTGLEVHLEALHMVSFENFVKSMLPSFIAIKSSN